MHPAPTPIHAHGAGGRVEGFKRLEPLESDPLVFRIADALFLLRCPLLSFGREYSTTEVVHIVCASIYGEQMARERVSFCFETEPRNRRISEQTTRQSTLEDSRGAAMVVPTTRTISKTTATCPNSDFALYYIDASASISSTVAMARRPCAMIHRK